MINELTDAQERYRDEAWSVADAPADFIQAQLKGIVGFELPVLEIEGKWKVSQNQPERNRAGVVAGLRDEHCDAMANAVLDRSNAARHQA